MRRFAWVFGLLAIVVAQPASAQPSLGGWQSVDSGQVDPTYVGAIDSPADGATLPATGNVGVTGWFVDTSAQGWAGADAVQVLQGSTTLAQGSVGRDRPDVAATLGNAFWSAAGWQVTLDASQLSPGQTTLTVQVHTPGKGAWSRALNVTVGQASGSGEIFAPAPGLAGPPPTLSVLTPQPGGAVSTANRQYVISGTAGPVGTVDGVQVWLNGEANTDGATLLGDADLKADGTWSLFFDPAQFMPIDSNLYVYARSALNGKRREVVVHFSITNRR